MGAIFFKEAGKDVATASTGGGAAEAPCGKVDTRGGDGGRSSSCPQEAFPWRPTAEAAPFLARRCTQRVARLTYDVFRRWLESRVLSVEHFNPDAASWASGAVLVVPKSTPLKSEASTPLSFDSRVAV